MKRFKFNLEGYLKIKDIQEKKRILEFAKVNKIFTQHQLSIDEYKQASIDLIKEDANEFKTANLSLADKHYRSLYLLQLKTKMEVSKNNMELVKIELGEKQKLLLEASKEKKVIEVLKNNRMAEHYKKQQNKEQEEIDSIEMGKYEYRKKNNSKGYNPKNSSTDLYGTEDSLE